MDEIYHSLKNRIASALKQENINKSRKLALNSIRTKYLALIDQIPIKEINTRFRKIKQAAIQNLSQLIELATARLRENGCSVYYVTTPQDVFKILDTLINESLVVKCKTNTSKEIKLKGYLKARNIEVVETDLGDRIVQLSQTRPSHPLIPSLHVPKAQVARLFKIDKDPSQLTIEDIVEVAREGIRKLVLKANIGLSGANAIAAEDGLICLEENEGNQRLTTSLPRKHIVLAGIDKIVPTAEDALLIMKAAALGLAQRSGVYLSFISGPSKTADIDFQLTYGMHGPRELHVILIDNGRQQLIKNGYGELLYCANCGACVNCCPIYEQIGDAFGGDAFIGGRGLLYLSQTKDSKTAFQSGLNFCTGCQACTTVCPGSIQTYDLMLTVRSQAVKQNLILPIHQKIAESILQNQNPFQEPPSTRCKWLPKNLNSHSAKTDTLLFLGCMASYRVQSQVISTIQVLDSLDIPFTYLGTAEPCCGSVLRNIGLEAQFKKTQNYCQEKFLGFSEIITICPGCYSTFKTAYPDFLQDHNITVRHLIEVLPNYSNKFKQTNTKVTYHDPCHLGRHFNLYDPPRILFKKLNFQFQEMDYSKENARCCGAGAGVLSAFPNLANSIAKTRIGDALSTGAETLLTSCPFCAYSLSQIAKDIQVCSLQEFIAQCCLK
ncbi:MAG: LUD domain-containing protein [Candidatus Helarchaeota archaeon]|nr:LUD domain-containing protein [Candidatus Helarchaeota archaeon]